MVVRSMRPLRSNDAGGRHTERLHQAMTRHNFLQKRSRLLKAIRAASEAYLWSCNKTSPQARRATTLAARRLREYTGQLSRLGTL